MRNGMWLPLIASVGIGAAAYYSMRRNNGNSNNMYQGVAQTMKKVTGKSIPTMNFV